MSSLSNYYQGLPSPTIPTFEKYLHPEPVMKTEFIEDAAPYLSFLAIDYDVKEYWRRFEDGLSRITRVDLKLSWEQVQVISRSAKQSTHVKISTMDAVAAYIITVIQRISDPPLRQIHHIVDVFSLSLPT